MKELVSKRELTKRLLKRRSEMEAEFFILYGKWRRQALRDMRLAINQVGREQTLDTQVVVLQVLRRVGPSTVTQNAAHHGMMYRFKSMVGTPQAVTYSFGDDKLDDSTPSELQPELVAAVKLRDAEVALAKQTTSAVAAVATAQTVSYFANPSKPVP